MITIYWTTGADDLEGNREEEESLQLCGALWCADCNFIVEAHLETGSFSLLQHQGL